MIEIESHDRYEPKLRVKASGFGGSGYCIPTRKRPDGSRFVVPGVTTVTGVFDKGGVAQWAVNQTAAWAVNNIDALLNRTQDQGYKMLRYYWKRKPDFDDPTVDIRDYHVGVLDDAAELGTLTHDWVAEHVNGNFEPELTRIEQVEMVQVFLRWMADHDIIPVLTEVTVVGEEYAGTLDHIWKIHCNHDGEPCVPGANEVYTDVHGTTQKRFIIVLVDVKTSRATRDEHYAQLGALGAADTLMVQVTEDDFNADLNGNIVGHYNTKKWGDTYWIEAEIPAFSEYAILQIRPDDVDNDGHPVPAYARLKHIPHEVVDQAYEYFLGGLKARHAQLQLKRAKKDVGLD